MADDKHLHIRKLELLRKQQELVEGLPHLYGFPHYKWSREFFESRNKFCFLNAANQIGKAQLFTEDIPTPDGFKKMGDIVIGDLVFGGDGKPCRVTAIPYIGEDECYEIFFSSNESIIASKNHLWKCMGPEERFRKEYTTNRGLNKGIKVPNRNYRQWQVRSTEEMINHSYKKELAKPTKKYVLPVSRPAEYEEKNLFDPYFVGLYLGNGSECGIDFNALDLDLIAYAEKYGNKHNLKADKAHLSVKKEYLDKLKEINIVDLSYMKKFPKEYLFGSVEQRKALLAGLLDTDGTIEKRGQSYSFCSTSYDIIENTKQLVDSLGGLSQVSNRGNGYYYNSDREKVICKEFWVLTIWTEFNPFRSKRKADRWKINSRYKHERVIDKIVPIGKRKVKCISVSSSDSTYLCGKNYIVTHNSSVQIRKVIHWATAVDLWPELWPTKPNQFWYLYPSSQVATIEVDKKWIPEFLPRNSFKEHPVYGWKLERGNLGKAHAIHFNTGVSIYFKTYMQETQALQSGTVHYMAVDEETPQNLFEELKFRLSASQGHYSSVFTATLSQQLWFRCMERRGKDDEFLPQADKWQVSKYDCQFYEDGTPSSWTIPRIKAEEASCSSHNEVLRRIYGRFIMDTSLLRFVFSRDKDMKLHLRRRDQEILPQNWTIYVGIDQGSGGNDNHPSAIVFLGVNPDHTKARVFEAWRGDGETTTAGDTYDRYKKMCAYLPFPVLNVIYDHAAVDLKTIADRSGESFTPANKARESGIDMVNTLFRYNALTLDAENPEIEKLALELESIQTETKKSDDTKDDLADALRYAVMGIPWDIPKIKELMGAEPKIQSERQHSADEMRRALKEEPHHGGITNDIMEEMNEWDDLMNA